MRKEPFGLNDIIHVIKRGARGLDIVLDNSDRWRYLLMIRHFNDHFYPQNWFRDLQNEDLIGTMQRPSFWPDQDPLVKILAYTLLDNHFHLVLKEIRDGGVSMFMHRLGTSMTNHFNDRYQEKGSIFQGAYKSVTVGSDEQLRYLAVYVMVKNTFEMYPDGGLNSSLKAFDKVWEWAIHYPYSSLGDYAGVRNSPIIDKDVLGEIFTTPDQFKTFAKECIEGYKERLINSLNGLTLEKE